MLYNFLINYSSQIQDCWFNELSKQLNLKISFQNSENSIYFLDVKNIEKVNFQLKNCLYILILNKDDFMHCFDKFNDNICGFIIAGDKFCQDAIKMINLNITNKKFEHLYNQSFKTTINLSIEKLSAISSLDSLLSNNEINERLKAIILTTFDELIMNAIYDAPIDLSQRHTLKGMGRDTILMLDKPVDIEILVEPSFVSFSITDYYGSFEAKTFNAFIKKHYKSDSYEAPEDKINKGGGLGLALSLQKGASLFLKSEEKKYTKIIAFFPIEESYKDFKKHSRSIINQLYKKAS